MDAGLRDQLRALPRLHDVTFSEHGRTCKLCAGQALTFDVVDLNKFCSRNRYYGFGLSGIRVEYWRCASCSFIWTDFFDDWSTADFAEFIYNDDYIKVDGSYKEARPLAFAGSMATRLRGLEHIRILDYGSGSGVFARALQDHGFPQVSSYDPFSSPAAPTGSFDLVTCFEVLEHTTSPLATLREMQRFLRPDGCIVFSQTLQPHNVSELGGAWWYLAPRNGHVSLYSAEALARLAASAGMTLHVGPGYYGFGQADVSPASQAILAGVGPSLLPWTLFAPAPSPAEPPAGDPVWHPVERRPDAAFRWSRVARIAWPITAAPATPTTIRIVVPFVNQIRPGFVEACRFEVGGQTVPVSVEGLKLVASVDVSQPDLRAVHLLTPEPLSPRELRGVADDRLLGIAVPLAPV